MFSISDKKLHAENLKKQLANDKAGAMVIFEGWVRNHNDGHRVKSLEYEAYELLCQKEAENIFNEAREKFNFLEALCVHRQGHLQIGDMAIWLGVTSPHRKEAFKACKFIIDEIKNRLPIWKKEHYLHKKAEWVSCQGCCDHDHKLKVTEAEYYNQQLKLKEVGPTGQDKLRNSRVLVVGAGGLGCPALQYLAAAGVGHITICDDDKIDASNLNRQILFTVNDISKSKAHTAKQKLEELNPFIKIQAIDKKLTAQNAKSLIQDHDLILDCTDNFKAKFLIHDACFLTTTPLVQASIYQFEGQVQSFLFQQQDSCLRCQWPEQPSDDCTGTCADVGVVGVIPGLLGTYQATEAIKILLGLGSQLSNKTQLVNVLNMEHMQLRRVKHPQCPLCGAAQIQDIVAENYELNSVEDWELTLNLQHKIPYERINILQSTNTLEFFASLPREKKYLMICQRGIRSKALVQSLRHKGHKNFYSLKGGLEAQL